MAETQANDVVLLQQVLIDNLQDLGFRSITAESIGDSEGVPDGILGDGTATALNTLAIMAQIEAGIDPTEMTTGYNADSAPLITAYIEKYASPEAAEQFSGSIQSIFPGGEFNENYDEAIIRNDTVAREINVAQFRNMAEGAVSITQGTPPPTFSTSPLKDQITAMQEVIFTGQILEQINMQADQIGNYQTGEADGILGKGTSEALQKLVILSERAAGRDGEEITGVYDATLVQTYLEANGVTAEDAQKFVDNAGQLNGNLQTLYAAIDIDPATVQLADNGSNVDENVADNNSRTVTMNYAQYEYLSAVATSEAGTAEDNLVTLAYGEAMKARADEIGLTAQEEILQERQEEYTRMVGADTTGFDTAALEAHLAANEAYKTETETLQNDVDTLKAQLHAANIEFTVPEGVGNEQLAAIRTSIATVETTQVAMVIEDDALNGSTLGTSDTLGPLAPVPISGELDGIPNVFGPRLETIEDSFISATDSDLLVSLEARNTDNPTIPVSYERFEELRDDGGMLSNDEKMIVANYETAYNAALQENGIEAAQARLDAATAAKAGVGDRWDAAKERFDTVSDELEAVIERVKATDVTYEAMKDGRMQEFTASYNTVSDQETASWYDTSEEQGIFDAGYAAYEEKLAADPEYQRLMEERSTLDGQLYGLVSEYHGNSAGTTISPTAGSIYSEANQEFFAATQAVNDIESGVQEQELAVSLTPAPEENQELLVGADVTVQTQSLGG